MGLIRSLEAIVRARFTILMCARGLAVATSNVMAMICKRARMPIEDGPGARSAALTLAGRSWRASNMTHSLCRARLQAMNEGVTCASLKHRIAFFRTRILWLRALTNVRDFPVPK